MSSVSSQGNARGIRTRSRSEARREAARRSALRSLGLESLEVRSLLSTLPTSVFNPTVTTVGGPGATGNLSTPSITVDPNNPSKLVAVWTDFDPTFAPGQTEVVQAAYSNDGGSTWQGLGVGGPILDPTSSATSPTVIAFETDASVAFDRNDNVYILYSQHNAGNTAGALLLTKYNFSANTPASVFSNNRVYGWIGDGAISPQLAVDSSVASFSDTDSNGVTRSQSDVNSGNVYVTFQATDVAPAAVTNLTFYDANRIKILASSDGGQTFSGVKQVSNPSTTQINNSGTIANTVPQDVQLQANNNGSQREVTPTVVVSQGSAMRPPGTNGPTDPGTSGVTPGQVTVVWDTYQTQGLPTPPIDTINSGRFTDGAYAQSFAGQSLPVVITPGGAGTPNVPMTTPVNIPVNITSNRFIDVSDLTVQLAILDPNLNELSAVLVPPTGSGLAPITLFANQTDDAGNANMAVGISGGNLGIAPDGELYGTTFDDGATRNIVDFTTAPPARGAAAPFVGHFGAEGGSLNQRYAGAIAGAANSPGSVNGNWTLEITDFRNSTPTTPNLIRLATLDFTSGLTPQPNRAVATSYAQAIASGRSLVTPADPFGVAPDPQIASDNTLGAYSPYEGRIYVAYVDKLTPLTNDANNFDVFLAYSDDGGQTWQSRFDNFGLLLPVNDDLGVVDGSSGGESGIDNTLYGNTATANYRGRLQFMPSVAVDPSTGTVALSWYDARNDASDARVATYTATSSDGGQTFSTNTYANASTTATDGITLNTVNLGPVPDNQSSGDSSRDTTFSYGTHQGLAFLDGKLHPIWSGNENVGGGPINPPPHLSIFTNTGEVAGGPRIVAATQGPVGQPGDTVNNQRAADGTPIASAFQVTFDRPIDPSTFGVNDALVMFRDTVAADTTPTSIPVLSVVPVNEGLFGATVFQINFAPQSAAGTYSLEVTAADIRDRIRSVQDTITPTGSPVNVSSTNVPVSFTTSSSPVTSSLAISGVPAGEVVQNLTVTLSITSPDDGTVSAYLIAPNGTLVPLVQQEAIGQNFTNTTFSDAATKSIAQGAAPYTGTFTPDVPLAQFNGLAINGDWRLELDAAGTVLVSKLTAWSLKIQPGTVTVVEKSGNLMDQNANGTPGQARDFFATPKPTGNTPFVGPYDPTTLPLILPGPHVASTSVPGQPVTSDNLVLNGTADAIDVTFDRDMNPASFTAASVLSMVGPLGAISGPFVVTPDPTGADPDPSHPRTFQVSFPAQSVSGTYTLTLASSITDARGNALDTNLNAGLDLLRGTVTGPTTPVTYNASGTPLTIPATTSASSTLTVPDNFLVNGLTVTLNITEAHDPDLQLTLIAPDGTSVELVPYGTGATGTQANFQNTVFDDSALTLVQNGGPPFFGSFKPLQPLSSLNGGQAQGTWTLVVTSNPSTTSGANAVLNSWSLQFQKGQPSSGLGEAVADQASASFRIFNLSPTSKSSSTTWTPVGPASSSLAGDPNYNGYSGMIGGIAVDPSDPSGNTVYVAGASGGVWKTTDFLTNNPEGPTYVPLTNFGPTLAVNIGSIAVFGRNNDPRQSIIIAGTGDGDGTFGVGGDVSQGIGFLISKDGGATWSLLDSTNNNLPYASRDHLFAAGGGTSTMQVVVDPHPTPDGQVIIYAAMKGANGGLWRSTDTGQTWQQLSNSSVQGTDCDSVVLDYNSATVNAVSNPTGNVNVVYASFPGHGVYISPNRGQTLNLMAGGGADPLIVDVTNGRRVQVPVANGTGPTGAAGGRIVLAKPAMIPSSQPNASVENLLYESWLYAAVTDAGGALTGVYVTKDNGATWTQIKDPTLSNTGLPVQAIPTNDYTQGNYDVASTPNAPQGSYNLSLAVDPNDPQVVYVGGTSNGSQSGLIRIDISKMYDSHAVVPFDDSRVDGGTVTYNSTGRTPVVNINYAPSQVLTAFPGDPNGTYLNVEDDPTDPFNTASTVAVFNVASFTNDGSDTSWIPIDNLLLSQPGDLVPSSDVHRIVAEVDPLTGQTRLIVGDDGGVFTGLLDASGQLTTGPGSAAGPNYSRNGNLQLAQLLYGSSQPSTTLLGTQVASALFYGNSTTTGLTSSDPKILGNGNTVGTGETIVGPANTQILPGGYNTGTGVGVDQQGNNIVYQYAAPGSDGFFTDFFLVSTDGGPFVGRTSGLVQTANDPQWPTSSPGYGNGLTFGNFTVNPINGNQVVISSAAGRIFSTTNAGISWLSIGEPSQLDGSYAPALAYGAPDPSAPGGIGNLNNFVYAGTVDGHVYVTRTGGGANFGAWTNISGGLDGSPVEQIVTDPTRGSHDAYAVTFNGVYYMADSTAASPAWVNVTNALFSQTNGGFNGATPAAMTNFLTSIQADWRYVIPNATGTGTHPILYVSGQSGVYRSLDNGATWTPFPSQSVDDAPADFGYLPNVHVTDLNIVDGKVDPTTGRAVAVAGDPDILLATTFGESQFAITLSPTIFPSSVKLDTTLPLPNGSTSGNDSGGVPIVNVAQPYFDGLSEQSAFGNTVYVTLLDLTDPTNPKVIGGYNPADPSTAVAANETNAAGQFQIQVNPLGFSTTGLKTIGVQATDASGAQGNIATIKIDLQAKLISQQPPAAPTLILLPADDSSGGQDVTNVTSPELTGATDPDVQVQLFASAGGKPTGAALLSTTSDANGNFSFQLTSLADGTYTYQAVATNIYGSTTGSVLTFTVVTKAPVGVPTLVLQPASDTGIKGDNITANHEPEFVGVTVPFAKVRLYQSINGTPVTTQPLGSATADAGGGYTIQLAKSLNNGPISLQVGITDEAGNQGSYSLPLTVTIVTVQGDYLGNGETTPALFLRNSGGGMTFLIKGVNPSGGVPYGSSSLDVPFQGDFDGDGFTDLAVYRPSTNTWYEKRSSLGPTSFTLGTAGTVPFVGDFDGDGVTDVGAYNPKTGTFTVAESTAGLVTITLPTGGAFTPQAGDVPVPGNYDGTGVAEAAVYRPGTGQFFIDGPGSKLRVVTLATGTAGDVPVPGNYDNSVTSSKTEPAVFNPTTGVYLIQGPAGNRSYSFLPGDIPAPGDFDGTGSTEAAVYRQSTASFVIKNPALPNKEMVPYGSAAGTPVGAPYVYRNLPTATGVAPGDYLGNGLTQPAFFRRLTPTTGLWYVLNDASINGKAFGSGTLDVPLTGDFDGDGKTDLALYRPGSAQWYVADSSAGYATQLLTTFGEPNVDVPVPGNYFGTGKTAVAVYRPTTGQFFIQGVSGFVTPVAAQPGDVAVPGNYDNTGKDEPAVYRPGTGTWYIVGPSGLRTVTFGGPNDVPVPGRYDASPTNQSVEPAVWRPSTGQFFVHGPTGNRTYQFAVGDIPAPGDYDGLGKDEPAVFRPSTGQWLVYGPSDSSPRAVVTGFGGGSGKDIPALSPYVYRAVPGGGGVSASSFSVGATTPAGGAAFDFGSTARSLSTNAVSTPATTGLTPAPASAPVSLDFSAVGRVRPRQEAAPALPKHPFLALEQSRLAARAARVEAAHLARSHRPPG